MARVAGGPIQHTTALAREPCRRAGQAIFPRADGAPPYNPRRGRNADWPFALRNRLRRQPRQAASGAGAGRPLAAHPVYKFQAFADLGGQVIEPDSVRNTPLGNRMLEARPVSRIQID